MEGLECLSGVLSEDYLPIQNILKRENIMLFAPNNLEEDLRKLSVFIIHFWREKKINTGNSLPGNGRIIRSVAMRNFSKAFFWHIKLLSHFWSSKERDFLKKLEKESDIYEAMRTKLRGDQCCSSAWKGNCNSAVLPFQPYYLHFLWLNAAHEGVGFFLFHGNNEQLKCSASYNNSFCHSRPSAAIWTT